MAKQLKFTCRPAARGGTEVEALGFEGQGCTATIDSFVQAMGAEQVGETDLKDEYHMEDTQRETETE